jgi:ribosomal protein S18 acetylase RimI-like enzyme
MARHPVRPANSADRAAVVAILAAAFAEDPAMAWVWPDAARRRRRLPGFFAVTARIDADPAHWDLSLADDGSPAAAALWRPPGAWETPTSAMIPALPALIASFGLALPRALGLQAALAAHHPRAPHWYLQFAGCTPAHQGRGHGGTAIRARLAHCDAEGVPAALETATPANVGLYQALGFRVTDTFRHRDGPLFWAMWRDPQR